MELGLKDKTAVVAGVTRNIGERAIADLFAATGNRAVPVQPKIRCCNRGE